MPLVTSTVAGIVTAAGISPPASDDIGLAGLAAGSVTRNTKRGTMRRLFLLAPVVALLAASAGFATNASAASTTVRDPDVLYKSTVTPLPGNLPSYGAEAYSFNEFGNRVRMTKTAQPLSNVTVTMSSWACQSGSWSASDCVTTPGATFTEPITLNLYNAPATGSIVPGSRIISVTKTFTIPYRPSTSASCTTSPYAGGWLDGTQGCFNGKAHNVVFSLASLHIVLPQDFVFGITYNTSGHGYAPYGYANPCNATSQGCPYDSLNIALSQDPTNVTKGSDPDTGNVFQNTTAGFYCDGGANGVGTFRLDSPGFPNCWSVSGSGAPYYVPAVQFMET